MIKAFISSLLDVKKYNYLIKRSRVGVYFIRNVRTMYFSLNIAYLYIYGP